MMEHLLTQEEPLDAFEISQLEDLLRVLRDDCEMFGATGEDAARMSRIKNRISLERSREAANPL